MAFKIILESPSYGFLKSGNLYRPTTKEILKEVLMRINVFDKTNWLTALIFLTTSVFVVSLVLFFKLLSGEVKTKYTLVAFLNYDIPSLYLFFQFFLYFSY